MQASLVFNQSMPIFLASVPVHNMALATISPWDTEQGAGTIWVFLWNEYQTPTLTSVSQTLTTGLLEPKIVTLRRA